MHDQDGPRDGEHRENDRRTGKDRRARKGRRIWNRRTKVIPVAEERRSGDCRGGLARRGQSRRKEDGRPERRGA